MVLMIKTNPRNKPCCPEMVVKQGQCLNCGHRWQDKDLCELCGGSPVYDFGLCKYCFEMK